MEEDISAGRVGADAEPKHYRAIAPTAKSTVLDRLIEELAEPIHETRMDSLSQPGRPPRSLAAHTKIANATRASDPGRATRAMRDHRWLVVDTRLLIKWRPKGLS
jgi:GntR family transcriptional regulator, transcriptional repressor for pyruvate dehydrogenase complex